MFKKVVSINFEMCKNNSIEKMPLTGTIFVIIFLCVTNTVIGQQFVAETDNRFPLPTPQEYTNQLTVGDIDGDNDLDIIFANGGNFSTASTPQAVRLYLNDGNGVFSDASSQIAGGLSGIHRGVELGDINGDGHLDMILVQDFQRTPHLLINDGVGNFSNETNLRLPPLSLSSSRGQFGDIDNDGDLDLFITTGTTSRFTAGQFRLFTNDGNGFFNDVTNSQFPLGTVANNMDCIFGDVDGDFDLDIKTASTGTNNGRLYINNGSGTYTLDNSVPSDTAGYSYDFGDIDGDGDLDLLGANTGSGNSEKLMENDGNGNFTDVSAQMLSNPGIDDNDSKFFDYDNDGDLDLIIGALGGTSERFHNNDGNGVFTSVSGIITPITDSTLDVMVADMNNDNKLDIITGQGESGNFENQIYINYGPADTIPPRVVDMEQLPDTDNSNGPYVVRAQILDGMTSDRNFFHKSIELNYRVDGGPFLFVEMDYSGGQIYRGEIPGQPAGSEVLYIIKATDRSNNAGFGMPKTFNVTGSVTFDADGDGVVTLTDYYDFRTCMTGPGQLIIQGDPCLIHDSNEDLVIDLLDFSSFQKSLE